MDLGGARADRHWSQDEVNGLLRTLKDNRNKLCRTLGDKNTDILLKLATQLTRRLREKLAHDQLGGMEPRHSACATTRATRTIE